VRVDPSTENDACARVASLGWLQVRWPNIRIQVRIWGGFELPCHRSDPVGRGVARLRPRAGVRVQRCGRPGWLGSVRCCQTLALLCFIGSSAPAQSCSSESKRACERNDLGFGPGRRSPRIAEQASFCFDSWGSLRVELRWAAQVGRRRAARAFRAPGTEARGLGASVRPA
jgi:hypothetical protein